jgi:subtilase family serine protease
MTPIAVRRWSALILLSPFLLSAQSRIAGPVDGSRTIALTGSLRPGVAATKDRGPVEADFPVSGITLYFQHSPAQKAGLERLLLDLQDPASPQYHHWLSPEQFADRFGASHDEIDAVSQWLTSEGFSVGKIARSRTWMVFSGTARQVAGAFHAGIHRFEWGGKMHFAITAAPTIPEALAPVVMGIDGLDDFIPEPVPAPDASSPTGVHSLAPDDLAVIYDIAPLYQAGIDGSGMKIAVAGSSQFNAAALADVVSFRSIYKLPPNVPQPVLDTDYPDPGLNANTINEAHLDIEWAGAIARNATIVYVYSGTFFHAVQFAIDNNLAPVVTVSANLGCEAQNSTSNLNFYRTLAQQAGAQGITWVNSGGDAGAGACDANGSPIAVGGLSVRFPASVPEITAVGGTEFNETGAAYWATSNTASGASALSYIPERVWNDVAPLNALWAGGGGASTYFAKPTWQRGPGVPADARRDLPDIALAASANHDGFNIFRSGSPAVSGGTSASAPVFAGILALLNQYLVANGMAAQPGLGNINPALYQLAQTTTGIFHDITVGDNVVPCQPLSPDCTGGSFGFSAVPGYDLASGLGSLDVAAFVNQWNSQASTRSHVILTVASQVATEDSEAPRATRPVIDSWLFKITATETSGVATTITNFAIDGASQDLGAFFNGTTIPASGSLDSRIVLPGSKSPAKHVFTLSGVDTGGIQWTQQVSVSTGQRTGATQ